MSAHLLSETRRASQNLPCDRASSFNPCRLVPWGKEACFEPTWRRSGGVRSTLPPLVNPPHHMAGVAFASKPRPTKHNLTGIFGDRNHGTEYRIACGRNPAASSEVPATPLGQGACRGGPLGRSLRTTGTYQHRSPPLPLATPPSGPRQPAEIGHLRCISPSRRVLAPRSCLIVPIVKFRGSRERRLTVCRGNMPSNSAQCRLTEEPSAAEGACLRN
jgi:hypothetical protein